MPLQLAGRGRITRERIFALGADCSLARGDNRFSIGVDGGVYPCESPGVMEGPPLGNLNEKTVDHIFSKYDEVSGMLRLHLKKSVPDIQICQYCAHLRQQMLLPSSTVNGRER
ncbi:MAG: SPASM domain-containing protein [Bacilli bacterium]